ncbi:DUF2281 domain-containing protein [Gloeothece verrucosa]|uniref:DUF2281 domain-containing protein n=1 Tax=Gloeothece verrucosa (strain PCC 7822) TaxID=497965 RepID=E0UC80_GLOV7|nr:DUF2281 domain-containing protein [Gloeothece verrucosa]ADN12837.1 conserved hypothetical protein [Gloeothece verrucosa PCC 7822]
MTIRDLAIEKLRTLPEPLLQEVNDFIDFLIHKNNQVPSQLEEQLQEDIEIFEADFSDYLSNLEDYENRLARNEIQW